MPFLDKYSIGKIKYQISKLNRIVVILVVDSKLYLSALKIMRNIDIVILHLSCLKIVPNWSFLV